MLLFRLLLPAALVAAVAHAQPAPLPRPAPLGPICGDSRLQGRAVAPILGDGACGVYAPVEVATAAGVALHPPPTVTCAAARALATWLERGPKASFAALGRRLDTLTVVDAYSCRNRNRAADGRLSEHAFGRAIDIGAFGLDGGETVTVLGAWGAPVWGPPLRRIHDAGCGPFTTALGPKSNPLHADHLHFDVAERRSGPFCE